ncbi:MAG: hypothetical protein IKP73_03410 [Bacteroidales bacterium]|nr:hypothetical protein [Bacteroidales bacterium]
MDGAVIYDSEVFARWLYQPRFIRNDNKLNDRFISLRVFSGNVAEKGISGQILNRAGHNSVISCGRKYRRTSKDGTNEEERFIGYAKANVGNIRNLSESLCDKVNVILAEAADIPFHAEIRFVINGQEIDGNHLNARFLKYKDKLTELFSKDICWV